MVRLFKRAVFILGICAAIALANSAPSHKAQVEELHHGHTDVVLESEPSDMICRDGNCYPRAFVPTHEFQEVLEGQEIPPGLHVRMDFETHKKYAKLMGRKEPVDGSQEHRAVVVVDTDKTGTQHHDLGSSMQATFDAHDQQEQQQEPSSGPNILNNMPEFHKPNPHITMDEHAAFTEYLAIIESTESSLRQVEAALEELGELVSEMDFGLRLAQGSGLRSVMELLACHPDTAAQSLCDRERIMRSNAALVVGNAVQNHPTVQKAAIELDLHRHLLHLMTTESDSLVARRLLTAFGNLVRGNQNILTNYDIAKFAAIFTNSTDPIFRRKCAMFMTDFADPDMRKEVADDKVNQNIQATFTSKQDLPTNIPSWIPPEEIEQPENVEPLKVNVGPWCAALQENNYQGKDSDSSREAIADAIKMLSKTFPDSCFVAIVHTEL
ncbi:hypothetical protein BGW41_001026 [Actinomortierella wolfii]|nr:hypothetical protein BGW41_001026 [Actinomortierella wolfii]